MRDIFIRRINLLREQEILKVLRKVVFILRICRLNFKVIDLYSSSENILVYLFDPVALKCYS